MGPNITGLLGREEGYSGPKNLNLGFNGLNNGERI